jgi:hypothetical protein
MTPAESQLILSISVYGLAAASTFFIGYLAWLGIRPPRHRSSHHQDRNGH